MGSEHIAGQAWLRFHRAPGRAIGADTRCAPGSLQPDHIRTGFGTNQNRAAGAGLDQDDTTQDQRPHDSFAEVGLFDHQGAQIFRRNKQRYCIPDGVNVDECRLARQLPHFGDELTGSLLHDRSGVPQGIAPGDTRGTLISTYMPGAMFPVTNRASRGA